jgi:VWFA-related protein
MQGTASCAAPNISTAAFWIRRHPGLLMSLAAMLCMPSMSAQQPDSQPTYTLHLYTNLMQIAALVLDSSDQPPRHVDTSHFALQIDGEPTFRPSYVRLQGNDPLSLTILLDLSGGIAGDLPALRKAIPALATGVLGPQDRVSVYALDCELIRSADNLPASQSMLLAALDGASAFPGLHGDKRKHRTCGNSVHLLNSIAVLTNRLAHQRGRRMLLIVSDGYYEGQNRLHWADVQRFAAEQSVGVFALTTYDPIASRTEVYRSGGSEFVGPDSPLWSSSFNLRHLCEMTGGTSLAVDSKHAMTVAIPRLFELARGRYILEFHRPKDATAGSHTLRVTLDKSHDHVYVGGATVALATQDETAAPALVPSTPLPSAASSTTDPPAPLQPGPTSTPQ